VLSPNGTLMPILPLDYPEPFAATLGVMLYPATNEADARKARAFAAQFLAEPIRRFHEAGHTLKYDALLRIQSDAGQRLTDLEERWWGGSATGESFKTLFALANTDAALASWNNANKIAELIAARAKTKGSRTALWEAKSRFLPVAHLWGAWSIRERQFLSDPEVGYDGSTDFQSFLAEAEILRRWGQTWRAPRAKSGPPLPPDAWQVPEGWEPPTRQPGGPKTGMIPHLTLPEDLLLTLKPSGRPRKRG
jgi:hypothetical protein